MLCHIFCVFLIFNCSILLQLGVCFFGVLTKCLFELTLNDKQLLCEHHMQCFNVFLSYRISPLAFAKQQVR